jgi:hypothetical protein
MSLTETHYNAKNITILNRFVRNPNRYYIEDFFEDLPTLETNPVITQQTSITTRVPLTTEGGFGAKVGSIKTVATALKTNIGKEFTFNNNFITPNSLVLTNLQKVSSNINDAETIYGNTAVSVMTHSKNEGSCKVRLFHQGNERRTVTLPSQTYDIGFVVDPQIPQNQNWSISGTNATDRNVSRAEGFFGTGCILSTRGADNDQCILQPRGYGSSGAKMGLFLSDTSITANNSLTLSIKNTGTTNPTHYFSKGDPVYLGTGNLLGILTNIVADTLTFGKRIPVDVSSDLSIHNRPPVGALGMSKVFTTDSEVEFECSLRTSHDISYTGWWAGLKQTSTSTLATDASQAYFFFDPSGATFTTLSSATLLHFVYTTKTSGVTTHYTSALSITVQAHTVYRLRIVIDSSRQVSVYVDNKNYSVIGSLDPKDHTQYSLTTTSGTTGATVSSGTTKSNALETGKDLFPFVGSQLTDTSGGAGHIIVNHVKVSRLSN